MQQQNEKMVLLLEKGVKIPVPESIFIDDDVDLSRISGEGVTLYPGTRIMGKETLIMQGVSLGFETPVTLNNVFVGADSRLNGGFFQQCVFAGRNTFGSGAHVREGTILEEEACAAHTVGLKQTILFPFVTLGSLINFCDCFMAGGTSRKDHSEVGSSFIHFNYTPNQDKATPSMLGNVHQGVMLNSRPVFLGGQGGLVGPCRIPFDTVTAAGTIWRKDVAEEGRLLFGGGMKEAAMKRKEGIYTGVKRIFINNCRYIAALISLMYWYRHVRIIFVSTFFEKQLLYGMRATLQSGIDERIKRLGDFVKRLEVSRERLLAMGGGERAGNRTGDRTPAVKSHDVIIQKWPFAREVLLKGLNIDVNSSDVNSSDVNSSDVNSSDVNSSDVNSSDVNSSDVNSSDVNSEVAFDGFAETFSKSLSLVIPAIEEGIKVHGRDYIRVIQNLETSRSVAGSQWLESIENLICNPILYSIEELNS